MWVLDPQTSGGMWEELTPSAGRLPPGPALAFPSSPSCQEAGGWAEGPGPAGMLP